MRDFLFRGKAIEEKAGVNIGDWVHGSLFISTLDEVYIFELGTDEKIEVDPTTVGQYTGLKDINGRMVYEGDLLTDPGDPDCVLGEVFWDDEEARFFVNFDNDYSEANWIERFELYGNRWDDPEAIKAMNSEE